MRKFAFTAKILIILSLMTSCGFKVVKVSDYTNFKIVKIETNGERRINYKLRNKLLLNTKNEEAKKSVSLILNTSKNKIVKEKNINNEITKYSIIVNVNVNFETINNLKLTNFSINKSGEYDVDTQYTQTLNNEKKAIDLITEDIANEILEQLAGILNAV